VVVLYIFLGGGGEVGWALAGQFDAGKAGCHGGMTSLGCYRGGECVIPCHGLWRQTMPPLPATTGFIPYVISNTKIYIFYFILLYVLLSLYKINL
jgi:hypothetical protein